MKPLSLQSPERIEKILATLKEQSRDMVKPAASSIIETFGKDPYLILVSCILSLRTKDPVSLSASYQLFKNVITPEQMIAFPLEQLEKSIHSVGFYRQKARQLKAMSAELLEHYQGKVPADYDALLGLTGVGPKTANLVLGHAFDIPAICVDTHVHKVSNRLGLVATKTVEQTQVELEKIVPRKYWIEFNELLVIWGQNICVPVSPFCSRCALRPICPRRGVTRSR